MVVTGQRIVAMIPEDDPSVIWPVCEPVLWESPDGFTWTPRSADSRFPEGAYVYDMAWRDGRFVAVGGIGFDNAVAWTSLDGTRWDRIDALAQIRGMDITQVESGPLGWIVTADPRDGSPLAGWFSPDGVCWESLPEGVAAPGVAIGEERVMFVDSNPARVSTGAPSDSILALSNCL